VNNNVNIEFMINVGDNRISATMQDAYQLYAMLHNMFGNRQPAMQQNSKPPVTTSSTGSVKEKTIEPTAEPVSREEEVSQPNNDLRERINRRLKNQQGGSVLDSVDVINERVEVARERAAARTSGCGSSVRKGKSCS
jgi:hypothetical protein